MTVDLTPAALCVVIEGALKVTNKIETLSAPVVIGSKMGEPREWDSLSFVAVFAAVSEAFDIELDDDDAIHFQAAQSIFDFLEEIMNE